MRVNKTITAQKKCERFQLKVSPPGFLKFLNELRDRERKEFSIRRRKKDERISSNDDIFKEEESGQQEEEERV